METIKATVSEVDEKHFINIELPDGSVAIPMSDDKADAIKSAFNKLILQIKKGEFQVTLEGGGEDLFSQVAKEYIKQLNKEIKEVRAEMKEHGLVS